MTELITFLEDHWKKIKKLEVREHKEVPNRKRDQLKRDYARVIYSTSFRRQQGKMQLFEVNSKAFHRNRLTHSFEVSQIAHGIVDELKKKVEKEIKEKSKNTDIKNQKKIEENFSKMSIVVETGSLIHDVGNPPFGHHGERVLNDLAPDVGFEGNAQGIRVLRKIEKKFPQSSGLNLTYRTLAAIIKYFVPYDKGKKKFLYRDDYDELSESLKDVCNNKDLPFRTIDVQIVDLADEIAYCAHDLEDALASNYFTIDEFIFRLENIEDNELNIKSKKAFNTWVRNAKTFAKKKGDKGLQSEDYDFYFRRELISIIVNKLIKDIGVIQVSPEFQSKTGTMNKEELGFKNYEDLAEALKTTIFKCVTSSDNIMLYERVGTKILTKLFELFMNDEYNKDGMLMPVEYRWNREDNENKEVKSRKVLDYISGMMDTYAIEVYMKHFGEDPFNVKYVREIFSSPKKYRLRKKNIE